MRPCFIFHLALSGALLLAACGPQTVQMMQPPAETLRGHAWVADIDLSLDGDARTEVAAADARLAARPPRPDAGAAALPFAKMFVAVTREVASARHLTEGRPLRVQVEMDRVDVQGTANAAIGRGDRMAGQVRLFDGRTGEPLGAFYVDVDKVRPGLIGLAIRGTGVREQLAREFAERIADQLTAKR